ncbi:MAG: MFS transporter [Clostridia bacterium]|nr:MFS transporter [Clostridia bacterium]
MKIVNRWFYAAIGVVALLFAGLVYAWSVLSAPIAAEFPAWSKAELSLTFTLVMTLFCVGCLVGGFLSGRISPKVYCWTAAALFLAGFFIASRTQSLLQLYIGFGLLCGFASGLIYNAAMSTVGRWFPDKQGLISGILLMGFGISSFIAGKIYQAATPDVTGAWRQSFVVLGIISAVVVAACGFFMNKPGADFAPPAPAGAKRRAVNPVAMEARPLETLKSSAFWLYYVWAILLSAAGLAIVSQATGMVNEIGAGVSGSGVATIVGLISIFNGIGRILLGGTYDRAGRNVTMQIVNGGFILTAVVLILALKTGSLALIVAGFILGGLSYGGVTPTNSAFISSYFGMKNYPVNFSFVNTNLIIASFGSTIAGALYDGSQSYLSTFFMMIVLAALGILLSQAIVWRDRRAAAGKG